MRFFWLLYICILLSARAYPQKLTLTIDVLNSADKSPVPGCSLGISADSGKLFQYTTNATGRLFIRWNVAPFKKAQIFPLVNKDLETDEAPVGFLGSDEKLNIDLSGKDANDTIRIHHIFYLAPVSCFDLVFPAFFFKENSVAYDTVYITDLTGWVDSSAAYPSVGFDRLTSGLKKLKRMVIGIEAHADYAEREPDTISALRAMKIRNELIKLGIPKERLICKAWGTNKLRYTPKQIKKYKRKKRPALHANNRRVVFKIMSWDFAPEVIISGMILNSRDHTVIPNAVVIYKNDRGALLQTTSDKDGHYVFNLPNARWKKAEVYTQVTRDCRTPTASNGFFASEDRLKADINDSTGGKIIFRKDFYLNPNEGCRWFTNILFKKNSVAFDTVYPQKMENFDDSSFYLPSTNIEALYRTLKDNPTIIVEISGHCSADENADMLSQRRAQKVVDELVKMGVNKNRLVAKGYGITKLKIPDQTIAAAITKKEKDALHAVNRRCVFKILSWDFEDPNAPKTEPEKYHPKVSEEEEK